MQVVGDPRALRRACDEARNEGLRVAVVPTMGALHAGHLSLVEIARQRADFVVVTIFVNPTQFGSPDDLTRYPRPLKEDLRACRKAGVDLAFTPESDALYAHGNRTRVQTLGISECLEGTYRPGHFDGVTTIVTKLLALTSPCTAVFGRKDYQQWRVLEQIVEDLLLPVEVVGAPIVREHDGLAKSSRNRHLSPDERKRALAIVGGLNAACVAFEQGERVSSRLVTLASAPVDEHLDKIDYVALVDPETLQPIETIDVGARGVLLVAAHLGATRLIDNLVLGGDSPPLAAL